MLPHRHLPRAVFLRRLSRNAALALAVVAGALAIGTLGYHFIADLPWVDSLMNAAMILTSMGPVDPMTTTAAKLFATFYALLSGLVFLSTFAIVIAPVVHRFLHAFHMETPDDESTPDKAKRPAGKPPRRG